MGKVNHWAWRRFVGVLVLAGMFLAGPQPRPAISFVPTAQIAGNQAPLEKAKGQAIVPFAMLPSNHMLVRATINGKGPYRLIFDLGAPVTLLGNRAAEASGVVEANAPRSLLFSMRGEAEISKLQAGSLTVTRLPVIVFDHPALKALGSALGHPIDGIIGFTFFARYRTTIDYQTRQMTFEPVNFPIRDLLRELPDRLISPRAPQPRILAAKGLWGLQLTAPKAGDAVSGALVSQVLPGSPAALAGIRAGDVLRSLGNRWVTSVTDAYTAAQAAEPHKDTDVRVLREGKEQSLTVRPVDGV